MIIIDALLVRVPEISGSILLIKVYIYCCPDRGFHVFSSAAVLCWRHNRVEGSSESGDLPTESTGVS